MSIISFDTAGALYPLFGTAKTGGLRNMEAFGTGVTPIVNPAPMWVDEAQTALSGVEEAATALSGPEEIQF